MNLSNYFKGNNALGHKKYAHHMYYTIIKYYIITEGFFYFFFILILRFLVMAKKSLPAGQ